MAEHVRRIRRKRRVKRVRSGRLRFTPARLAICGASLLLGFGVGWTLLTYGPEVYRGWRESSLLKKASAMMADPGGGGCYYTYGWIVVNGTWIPVLIEHC